MEQKNKLLRDIFYLAEEKGKFPEKEQRYEVLSGTSGSSPETKIILLEVPERRQRGKTSFRKIRGQENYIKQIVMTKIKNLDLTKQHQEEALGFHQLASAETAKCKDAKFTPLQTAYETTITPFDEAPKTGGVSVLSEQLADLDAQRDKAYSSLAAQIKNAENHFDAAKAAAAKEANLILRKYGILKDASI